LLGDDLIIAQAYQSFTKGMLSKGLQQIETYPINQIVKSLEKSLLTVVTSSTKNYTGKQSFALKRAWHKQRNIITRFFPIWLKSYFGAT